MAYCFGFTYMKYKEGWIVVGGTAGAFLSSLFSFSILLPFLPLPKTFTNVLQIRAADTPGERAARGAAYGDREDAERHDQVQGAHPEEPRGLRGLRGRRA